MTHVQMLFVFNFYVDIMLLETIVMTHLAVQNHSLRCDFISIRKLTYEQTDRNALTGYS